MRRVAVAESGTAPTWSAAQTDTEDSLRRRVALGQVSVAVGEKSDNRLDGGLPLLPPPGPPSLPPSVQVRPGQITRGPDKGRHRFCLCYASEMLLYSADHYFHVLYYVSTCWLLVIHARSCVFVWIPHFSIGKTVLLTNNHWSHIRYINSAFFPNYP